MFPVNGFRVFAALVTAVLVLTISTYGQDSNAAKAKPFYDSGKARAAQGDYDGAVQDFSRALGADPKNAIAYAARGNAKLNLGQLDESIADFSKAIEIDPSRIVPYLNRGVAKVDAGDLEGAIADDNKVISLDAKNVIGYRNRGCAKQQKGDLEGARADFQQAIQLATDEGAYQRFYLFLLGLRQKPPASAADFKSAVRSWKEGWKRTVGLFLCGEIDESTLFEQAAQGTPKIVREQKCEGYYYAGMMDLIKGDSTAAKNAFDRCVATQLHTFPEFQLARAELARMGQN